MPADRSSFEAYVQARTAALSRVAYLLTGDHHLAEDLVQQTFLRIAGRWQWVVAEGDPDPYVRKVLYHQHVSWWRQARRVPQVALVGADSPVPDKADEIGTALAVQRALAKLAPKQRAALVLRYFEDLTEAQTAAALGCRVGTVTMQFSFQALACSGRPSGTADSRHAPQSTSACRLSQHHMTSRRSRFFPEQPSGRERSSHQLVTYAKVLQR